MIRSRGCDIGIEEALEDWLLHCADVWRLERQTLALQLQRKEIERYKWIESEKHGHDLGRQAAIDWVTKYAAAWREWFETEYDPATMEEAVNP